MEIVEETNSKYVTNSTFSPNPNAKSKKSKLSDGKRINTQRKLLESTPESGEDEEAVKVKVRPKNCLPYAKQISNGASSNQSDDDNLG